MTSTRLCVPPNFEHGTGNVQVGVQARATLASLVLMEWEAGDASHAHKVAVQRKDRSGVFDRNGGNNGICGGQTYALGSRQAEEGRSISIGLETPSFQEVKKREIVFDALDVARQALKDLRHDHAR